MHGALWIWLSGDNLERPNRFLRWAIGFMRDGGYLVLAGEPAFLKDPYQSPADPELVATFFKELGVDFHPDPLDDFDPLKVRISDEHLTGYERELPMALENAPQFHVLGDDAEIYLSIRDRDDRYSDVVATTSGGGVVFGRYSYAYYPSADMGFWMVDPFELFRHTFRMNGIPAPDVTTLMGRRIYFSTVDGDGWNTVSSVADHDGVRRISAQVMYDELVKPYPDLPVTIGPVTGDLDPKLLGGRESRQAARRLFALPNVELATHTHTYPFDWKFYHPDLYDAKQEKLIFNETSAPRSLLENAVDRINTAIERQDETYNHSEFKVPRAYYNGPYNESQEIEGSIALIEGLAPAVRRCKWSCGPVTTRPMKPSSDARANSALRT